MVAPRIETARLVLRAPESRDLAGQVGMLGDEEVMRHLGGGIESREDAWRRLLAGAGLWPVLGFGYWTVERREDGRYLGQAGFADFRRDMTPSIEGLPEMGWLFARDSQGQGYAAEACAAALAWADAALDALEIAAIIDPLNERSIRLAEKLGFRRAEEADYKKAPILIFRRTA